MEAITESARARTTRSDQEPILPARFSQSAAIARELAGDHWIRAVKGLDVFSVTAADAPRLMNEIGRIREVEFRKEGGGTGRREDVDCFDLGDTPYRQLVVWDAQQQEVVAAYRYILCRDEHCGRPRPPLATERLFEFSNDFRRDYLPYSIELGRSVVNRSAKRRFLGLFAAWAGLGALVSEHRDIRYLFGKVTMYPTYNVLARDVLLHFLRLYFPDPAALVRPRQHLEVVPASAELGAVFRGRDYATDYARLRTELKELGELIPPLLISYLGLTQTMKAFGTARNPEFGNVDETAILITVSDINKDARTRFIGSYERICPGHFCDWSHDCEANTTLDCRAVTGRRTRR